MTQIPADLLGLGRIETLSVELKNNSVYIEVTTDYDDNRVSEMRQAHPIHRLF